MIILWLVLIYIIIGIAIVEQTCVNSHEYRLMVHNEPSFYIYEVLSWLPDMIEFWSE